MNVCYMYLYIQPHRHCNVTKNINTNIYFVRVVLTPAQSWSTLWRSTTPHSSSRPRPTPLSSSTRCYTTQFKQTTADPALFIDQVLHHAVQQTTAGPALFIDQVLHHAVHADHGWPRSLHQPGTIPRSSSRLFFMECDIIVREMMNPLLAGPSWDKRGVQEQWHPGAGEAPLRPGVHHPGILKTRKRGNNV